MARPLRLEYRGAMYYIMARGNQGRAIFEDDKDRQRFVETLGEACGKAGWRLHAYVLMNNHYHLLAETPEGNLVAGMKWLQGTTRSVTMAGTRALGICFKAVTKRCRWRRTTRAISRRSAPIFI